jgi:hypothetical protein
MASRMNRSYPSIFSVYKRFSAAVAVGVSMVPFRIAVLSKSIKKLLNGLIVDHYYRHVPAPDYGDRLE